MRVLVVGQGAREHAIAWKLKQSPLVRELYAAPGNAGIAAVADCVNIGVADVIELADFAEGLKMDLTVVGPELPLTLGIVAEFQKRGLPTFGPTRLASELEGSKIFSKEFMRKYSIPTAEAVTCGSADEARAALKKMGYPPGVQGDGLAAGEGGVLARKAHDSARRKYEQRGRARGQRLRARRDAHRGAGEGVHERDEGALRRRALPPGHRLPRARKPRAHLQRHVPERHDVTAPFVCIVMGSDSDAEVMAQACAALDELGVAYEMKVASAHRSPERTKQVIDDAERDGAAVFIAGAGMAAHLPGVVASFTTRPVIGVPLAGSALLAIVQMPPGIPVATVAIGGARNAGVLAAQIMAASDAALAARLKEQRVKMAEGVALKSRKVEKSTRTSD